MIEITSFYTLLFLGLSLGLMHALEGDHIAAILAMSDKTKNPLQTSLLGAVWGLGHTATLLFIGLLVLMFKLTIPDGVAYSFEFIVGIVLVVLGVNLIRKIRAQHVHIHIHEHDGEEHAHFHSHESGKNHRHMHKTFGIGLLHGLAGSGVLLLLILATTETVTEGLLFILVFGIGSTFGMSIVSLSLGFVLRFSEKYKVFDRRLRMGAGCISIGFGCMLMYTTVGAILV